MKKLLTLLSIAFLLHGQSSIIPVVGTSTSPIAGLLSSTNTCTGTTGASCTITSCPIGCVIMIGGNLKSSAASPHITIASLGITNATCTSQIQDTINASNDMEFITCIVSGGASGTSVTITPSAATTNIALTIAIFFGLNTSSLLDGSVVANSGTSASPVTGSYTSAVANDIIVAMCIDAGGPITNTTTGWVNLSVTNAASAARSQMNYLFPSTAGSQVFNYSIGSAVWGTTIAGFKVI